jgi:hypothetical protein
MMIQRLPSPRKIPATGILDVAGEVFAEFDHRLRDALTRELHKAASCLGVFCDKRETRVTLWSSQLVPWSWPLLPEQPPHVILL